MAPYNSVTSTPSSLGGRGTSPALFAVCAVLCQSRAAARGCTQPRARFPERGLSPAVTYPALRCSV